MRVKKTHVSIPIGILLSLAIACLAVAYPTVFPTGTTIYKPNESYSSYILVSDHASLGNHPSAKVRAESEIPDDIRLIDMNGNVVHTWISSSSARPWDRRKDFPMETRSSLKTIRGGFFR